MLDGARMKYRSHRTRKLYQYVKNHKGHFKNVLYDDGLLMTTDEEFARKWANYLKNF